MESFQALLLDGLYLSLELLNRAREVVLEDPLGLVSEEIVALFLQLHAFLYAHVSPGVLDVRDTAVIDGCEVGLKHGQIHWTV